MLTIFEDCRKRQALDYRRFFGYNFYVPGSRNLFIIYHKSGVYGVFVIEYKWTFGKLVSVSFFYFTDTLPASIENRA